MSDVLTNHRMACSGFSAVVAQGEGRWMNPSPCPGWDAGAVVDHVIGFHDELLLRPTGTEPTRPNDDPTARWALTVPAIDSAMAVASSNDPDEPVMPGDVNLERLLPSLTAEVLVHTWDLAKAIGVDPDLDPELCEVSLDVARGNDELMRASGSFGAAVTVPSNADVAIQLIAFFGRDHGWIP
jgi:uncharacterized protein (TIGR03086 family)